MQAISINDAKTLIKTVGIEMSTPIFLWGPPGVGKSEMMAQVTNEIGGLLVDIRLSQYDSVDMRGIPQGNENSRLTEWLMPSTFPYKGNPNFAHVPDDQIINLFLDELNSATQSVAAVAYQLVNDRRVGEHELMDNVRVIAAGNRETDRGVTNRMPLPLANRFLHVEITVSVDDWCMWAQKQPDIPPVAIAFYQFRRPLLMGFDPSKGDKAFPTPRSSAKAWRIYNAPHVPMDTKRTAMAGLISDGVMNEAMGFIDIWQKVIPISKIVADPEGVPLPDEQSFCYATAVSVSGHLSLKNVKPLYTFLKRLDTEYIMLAWQLATARDEKLYETPEFLDFSKRYNTVFSGA